MASKITKEGRALFLCEVCGFGYSEEGTANACENYCTEHNGCSREITSKAVYRPE